MRRMGRDWLMILDSSRSVMGFTSALADEDICKEADGLEEQPMAVHTSPQPQFGDTGLDAGENRALFTRAVVGEVA